MITRMFYGLLGALTVLRNGRPIDIERPRRRALLTFLLLNDGQPVTTEQVVDALWGDEPPASARGQVHTLVSSLRKLLTHAGRDPLVSHNTSYALRLDDADSDLRAFRRHLAAAKSAAAGGRHEEVAAAARAGLALWRGEALSGITAPFAEVARVALQEERLLCHEFLADADLCLGRHRTLLPELTAVVAEHPAREALVERLVLALCRSGRQSEALALVRRTRELLRDEYGLDPRASLAELEQAVLRADGSVSTAPTAPAPAPVGPDTGAEQPGAAAPALLPPDIRDFTGRREELRQVLAELGPPQSADPGPLRICAVSGMGGIGKTTFAVHAAHRLQQHYPGGQLYLDLRGQDPNPYSPEEALTLFLRELGLRDSAIPVSLDGKVSRYRSLTTDRPILVVLDNARDSAQVRDLLPGHGRCGVLITSRRQLVGLAGARHIGLTGLSAEESHALLAGLAGERRVAEEPEATGQVLDHCSGLPLAVRITGARLASRPSWPVSVLAHRLADERRRLDHLQFEDVAVRASFEMSLAALTAAPAVLPPAQVWRRLGLLRLTDVDAATVAALMRTGVDDAVEALEALVDVCMLESTAPHRYQMHDLLHLYAAEQCLAEHPDARRAAVENLARWLLHTADAGRRILQPHARPLESVPYDPVPEPLRFDDSNHVQCWFRAEGHNTLAVAEAAADNGLHELAWLLAAHFSVFFRQACRHSEWERMNLIGLRSAQFTGDDSATARMLVSQASLLLQTARPAEAEPLLHSVLEIRRRQGDEVGELAQLSNLTISLGNQERYAEAQAMGTRALELARKLGRTFAEGQCLNNLGEFASLAGHHQLAVQYLQASQDISRRLGDTDNGSISLANLGAARLRAGDPAAAIELLMEALPPTREHRNRYGEAEIHSHLGEALIALDRRPEGLDHLEAAMRIWTELGDDRAERVRLVMQRE